MISHRTGSTRRFGLRAALACFGLLLLGACGGDDPAPATGERFPGYRIQALKSYDLTARVLSREDYRWGREADLSPTDLALGWGPMADPEIIRQFKIRQRGRWYYWETPRYPIPRRDIETHSANVHIIPADDWVALKLEKVEPGDLLRLQGQLVEVRGSDGWLWRSSLTFEDTGHRACELLLLERVTQV
jgi:hypothetical protein